MAKIILITGGARSGKSSYAQSIAESLQGTRVYIATCPPVAQTGDSEMGGRILRHRQEREQCNWSTVEEQIGLIDTIKRCGSHKTLLIDCLTLWVNNILFMEDEKGHSEEAI